MRKVILSFIYGFLVLGILTGCGNSKIDKSNDYLMQKYNQKFSFKAYGDSVTFSTHYPLVYSDNFGNDFIVQHIEDLITDNYCSAIYDNSIQSDLQNHYGDLLKVFVSTQNTFFGESKLFENYYDYLKKCPVINIVFYTKDSIDLVLIKDYLDKYNLDLTDKVSAVIYQVDVATYYDVKNYNYDVDYSHIIDSQSFIF